MSTHFEPPFLFPLKGKVYLVNPDPTQSTAIFHSYTITSRECIVGTNYYHIDLNGYLNTIYKQTVTEKELSSYPNVENGRNRKPTERYQPKKNPANAILIKQEIKQAKQSKSTKQSKSKPQLKRKAQSNSSNKTAPKKHRKLQIKKEHSVASSSSSSSSSSITSTKQEACLKLKAKIKSLHVQMQFNAESSTNKLTATLTELAQLKAKIKSNQITAASFQQTSNAQILELQTSLKTTTASLVQAQTELQLLNSKKHQTKSTNALKTFLLQDPSVRNELCSRNILPVNALLHHHVTITGDTRQSNFGGLGIVAQKHLHQNECLTDHSAIFKPGTAVAPGDIQCKGGYFDGNMLSKFITQVSTNSRRHINVELQTQEDGDSYKLVWKITKEIPKDAELKRSATPIADILKMKHNKQSINDIQLLDWELREMSMSYVELGDFNHSFPIKIGGIRIDQKIKSGWESPAAFMKMAET